MATRGTGLFNLPKEECYAVKPDRGYHAFCYKVHAVRERLTWVEALQYCRTHHTDLASVASETEMMLIKKELSKDPSSDGVWIGLRFLAGEWLWVDGQPFSYESWGASVKPSCPDMSFALEGWNVHDCEVRRHFLCY
uniref:C-type lectin domain-containing protein n=1 Tax=Neogobius melanostomus TaxID=47308 RepID=A0A8C6SS99_9GOBI